ncbi:MAG TPA: HAMP domain-containing sensor histidine kinase, partial [Polyangiales bacterium]
AVSRVGALAPRAVSHDGASRAITHSRTPIRRVADANGSVADLLAEPLGATVSETFSAPLADGRSQIGVLQIINPLPRGDSEETTLRRLGLLAAQLGRGIVLRREREANERAKRLAMLGDAMSMVSHDLRTPLTAAAESLDGLVGEDAREARELSAGRATRALEQIENTIDDVLSFARGRREVSIRHVNLGRFVERLREMLTPELAACAASLEIHDDYQGPARFDENKWQRVIWNLMRHACLADADKFALRIAREGELLIFECTYSGPNVKSVVERQLIELLEPSGASEVAGFGLALARKIVDAHCGRIHVQSEAPNGTVFRIEIPI